MAIGSFIFGGDTGETPDSLKRRREIQDQLAAQIMGEQPKNTMGGIGAMLQGLAVGYGRYKDNKLESTNREAGTKTANDLLSRFFTGNKADPSNAIPGANAKNTYVQPPVEGTMRNARDGDRASMADYAAPQQPTDMRQGIAETAASLGIDPVDLATAISYETGGTFDPTKAGPTTQWGKHRGLIQFGEPQAKEFGVDWNNPVGSQLGKDGAIAKYLKNAGVQPGMGMMDLYSAINAGQVGRYDASDANNGGAPGTVADKVNNQMAAHRQKALALLGDQAQNPAVAAINAQMPQDVASNDPSIGMRQQVPNANLPMPDQTQVQQPKQISQQAQVQQHADQQQVAQNQANPFAGVDPKLFEALKNPWIPPETRAMLQTVIQEQMKQGDQAREEQTWRARQEYEQQQQQNDPAYKMGLEKGRVELDALKNPGPEWDTVTGKDGSVFRFDKRSGKMETLYGAKPEEPDAIKALRIRAEQSGLKPGTPEYQQFMQTGGTVEAKPTDIREYEYAKQQGYAGNFQQWQLENKKAGAANFNIDQRAEGAFDKKLAEAQAQTFSTMADEGMNAKADVAIIDELDGLIKGQGGMADGLSAYAAKWGIGGDGVSDLQAANALISKLVPTQRQPGSGTMSDRDVELFKESLPSLWNQPGGNEKIVGVMRGLAKYKQDQGEIADQVLMGEMTRQEARRALRALPNPLEDFRKNMEMEKKAATADPPDGVEPDVWSVMTPEEKSLWLK